MRIIGCLIFAILISTSLNAATFPKKVGLDNGKTITIFENRTWEYEKENSIQNTKKELVISSINVDVKLENIEKQRYQNEAWLTFIVKNNYKKDVAAADFSFEVVNAFGEKELDGYSLSTSTVIKSGEQDELLYIYKQNIFLKQSVYDVLNSITENSSKKIVIKPIKIAFVDGEVIELGKNKKK